MSSGKGEGKASARKVAANEKQRQALELRKAGATYEEIARTVGYSGPQGAHKAVMSALQKTLQEPADELRTLELDRLDKMQMSLWKAAIGGNQGAIDRVLKIMERRAKLLGIEAPQKIEVEQDIAIVLDI